MPLHDKLKNLKPARPKPTGPAWAGPESDASNGGITFSLLSRFLCCRERFRLLVVEGLRPTDAFNHRIEYGNMWHVCEEALAGTTGPGMVAPHRSEWEVPLGEYVAGLTRKYPTAVEAVRHWADVCRVQFPLYVGYWAKHPDVTGRTPLLQEVSFRVPYDLPSGRRVYLRGKWDSVDLVLGKGKGIGIYLQENKTKGDIDERQMQRQLTFDLQTMLYLTALGEYQTSKGQYRLGGEGIPRGTPIRGVRYNVVRRPLSGGKGTIKQKQGESRPEYLGRLKRYIEEAPETYFMRWKVEVTPADVEAFRRRCLDPVLEQLCEWWDWVKGNPDPFAYEDDPSDRPGMKGIHHQFPFGVYNPMLEGNASELDEYLATGSEAGLTRTGELFPELKEQG